jgi:ribose 1,5-bisphosphokinase PhnN
MTDFQKLLRVTVPPEEEQELLEAAATVVRLCKKFAEVNPQNHLRVALEVSQLWYGDPVEVKWRVHLGNDYTNEGKAKTLPFALAEFFNLAPAAVIDNTIRRNQEEIKRLKRMRRHL